MYSELDDSEKNLYLRVLDKSSYYKSLLKFSNFQKQKSKVSLFHINEILLNLIKITKLDKTSRILPILASSEIEKTQFYALLKHKEEDCKIIYVPNPPPYVRIYFHVYNCIIEELGIKILEETSEKLLNKYIIKRKETTLELGLKEILQRGNKDFLGKHFDCFKAMMIYKLDNKRKDLAKRWLLGADLTREDFEKLGIKSKVEEDVISFEMIKLISEFFDHIIVLYFDDIEMPYENYGERAEIKMLEALKRFHHDIKKLMIIVSSLKKSWNKILNVADQSFCSILEPEQDFFDLNGLKKFVQIAMDIYWVQNDLRPPINPYFPLNPKILGIYYKKTKGNIRNFLTICTNSIEKIGSGELSLEELQQEKEKNLLV